MQRSRWVLLIFMGGPFPLEDWLLGPPCIITVMQTPVWRNYPPGRAPPCTMYLSLSHLYEIRISIRAWLSVSAPCGLVFDVIVDKGTRPWNHRFRGRRCTATKSGCKDHDVSAGKENMENMSFFFWWSLYWKLRSMIMIAWKTRLREVTELK